MLNKIGFVGCGNMTKAMINGFLNNKNINSKDFFVYDINFKKMKYLKKKYNVSISKNIKELFETVDIFIISTKPNAIFEVIRNINNCFYKKQIVISLAAGIEIKKIEEQMNKKIKIIRMIPNISVMINKGIISIIPNLKVKKIEIERIFKIFKILGKVKIINESLSHIITAISSSLPAYIYIFIESISDAVVMEGMEKKEAFKFSSEAIKGASEMILKTKIHPSILKDKICSLKGMTIEGIKYLEKNNFRYTIIKSIINCIKKSKNILK